MTMSSRGELGPDGAVDATEPTAPRDWLSLAEASHLLGVSRNTVRRWSDAGRVPVFITPGGHRRFARLELQRFLATEHDVARSLDIAASRQRILAVREHGAGAAWGDRLALDDRHDLERLEVEVLDRLLADVAARESARPAAQDALRTAASLYGRQAALVDVPLDAIVREVLSLGLAVMDELSTVAESGSRSASATARFLRLGDQSLANALIAVLDGHRRHD